MTTTTRSPTAATTARSTRTRLRTTSIRRQPRRRLRRGRRQRRCGSTAGRPGNALERRCLRSTRDVDTLRRLCGGDATITGPLADNLPANDGVDTDSDGLCDVGDLDDDNDTLADIQETDTGVFNGLSDTGTDPTLFDTDSDGWSDADEISLGTDPNDPASNPEAAVVPLLSPLGLACLVLLLGAGAVVALRRGRGPAIPS